MYTTLAERPRHAEHSGAAKAVKEAEAAVKPHLALSSRDMVAVVWVSDIGIFSHSMFAYCISETLASASPPPLYAP